MGPLDLQEEDRRRFRALNGGDDMYDAPPRASTFQRPLLTPQFIACYVSPAGGSIRLTGRAGDRRLNCGWTSIARGGTRTSSATRWVGAARRLLFRAAAEPLPCARDPCKAPPQRVNRQVLSWLKLWDACVFGQTSRQPKPGLDAVRTGYSG